MKLNKKALLLLITTATVIFTSCKNDNAADKVLHNAKVYTVDSNKSWAEAVAIKDGVITFVGSNEDVKKYIGSTTKVIDVKGKMVLPGFQDAHVHPMEGMSLSSFMGCDLIPLMEQSKNPEDWKEEMRKCYEIDYPHDWILGGGHSIQSLMNLKRSPRELLDEIFPDKPALFMEKTSHSMWANSLALKAGGITKDTPNSQGGMIIKDVKTGEPNGILMDSAGDELIHIALAANPALQQARFDAIVKSQDYLAKYGITAYTNARVYWDRGNRDPWLRAEKEGVLKSRGIMALWAYPHMDDDDQLKKLKSFYKKNDDNSLIQWTMIKYYSDGLIDNNSAAVIDKYAFIRHPDSEPFGLNYFTEDRLTKYITELEEVGFNSHIHAIGDRGVRESLNAFERVEKNNPTSKNKRRHQITHVETIRPSDIPRFKELNVTANIQYNLEIAKDFSDPETVNYKIDYSKITQDDPDLYYKIMGDVNIVRSPILEIKESGGRVCFSSDWDVASIDPIFSIEEITRRNQGRLPKDELIAFAIEGYTNNTAYAMQIDKKTGSIEVGKFADVIVLDKNLFEIPVTDIHKTKVELTLLGGKEVYNKNN